MIDWQNFTQINYFIFDADIHDESIANKTANNKDECNINSGHFMANVRALTTKNILMQNIFYYPCYFNIIIKLSRSIIIFPGINKKILNWFKFFNII